MTPIQITRVEAAALLDMLPALLDSNHPNLSARYGNASGHDVLEGLHETIAARFEEER